jgi:hypothetical protein
VAVAAVVGQLMLQRLVQIMAAMVAVAQVLLVVGTVQQMQLPIQVAAAVALRPDVLVMVEVVVRALS